MTKIAPAVLEDIQNQVDATEFVNINEVNQSIKNDIKDQEDSTPPIIKGQGGGTWAGGTLPRLGFGPPLFIP